MKNSHYTQCGFISKKLVFLLMFIASLVLATGKPVYAKMKVIDILVVYDQAAENYATPWYIPHDNMYLTAQHNVTSTNLYLQDSGANFSFGLVGAVKVTHRELGIWADKSTKGQHLLNRLNLASQRLIDLRNQYNADLVVYLSGTMTDLCGMASLVNASNLKISGGNGKYNPNYNNAGRYVEPFSSRIFWTTAVVGMGCGSRTFAHELGHIMGLKHSIREGDKRGDIAPYGVGHGVDGLFGTVMTYWWSYIQQRPKHSHFSNPQVSLHGVPSGVPGRNGADAVRAMNEVASYYSHISDCWVRRSTYMGASYSCDRRRSSRLSR